MTRLLRTAALGFAILALAACAQSVPGADGGGTGTVAEDPTGQNIPTYRGLTRAQIEWLRQNHARPAGR